MSHQRVLRWDVPVDDDAHVIGGGHVLMVACRPLIPGTMLSIGATPRVEVWTLESLPDGWPEDGGPMSTREVTVVGTGHKVPDGFTHVGSTMDPDPSIRLVWHLFERQVF